MTPTMTYLWKANPAGYQWFYVVADSLSDALELADAHSQHTIIAVERTSQVVLDR